MQKNSSKSLYKELKSLFTEDNLRRFLVLLLGSLLIGFFLVMIQVIGETIAIGFFSALEIYGLKWILILVTPIIFFLMLYVAFLIFNITIIFLGWVLSARLQSLLKKYNRDIVFIFGVIALLILLISRVYNTTIKEQVILSTSVKADRTDLNQLLKISTEQSNSMIKLSENANSAAKSLSEAEVKLNSVKVELQDTFSRIENHVIAAEQASKEVESLIERQREIQLRTAELERILDGADPITLDDLQSSSRDSLIIGGFIGFLIALLTSPFSKLLNRLKDSWKGSKKKTANSEID